MSVVLYRVDERLIHGQVVVGWGAHLHPDHIMVVDNELAGSEWEQELYSLGLPPEIQASFTDVEGARRALPEWQANGTRTIVLTRDVRAMRELAEGGGLRGAEVNIGGIHYAPGRRGVLPYVYLSGEEREELKRLASAGATVTARDLPGSRRIDLAHLLQESDRHG